jgi:hypothetical protein
MEDASALAAARSHADKPANVCMLASPVSQAELLSWADGRDDAVELRVREALTGEQPAGVHAASGF